MNKTVKAAEIARYFRVPVYHVTEWISTGELIATKVNDRFGPSAYRVDESEFEAFKLRRAAAQGEKPQPRAVTPTPSPDVQRSRNMKKTLSPPEVAKYLHVRRAKVLAWIHSGELRATNVSDSPRPRYRIEEADFEEFKLRRSSRSAVPTVLGRPRRV